MEKHIKIRQDWPDVTPENFNKWLSNAPVQDIIVYAQEWGDMLINNEPK